MMFNAKISLLLIWKNSGKKFIDFLSYYTSLFCNCNKNKPYTFHWITYDYYRIYLVGTVVIETNKEYSHNCNPKKLAILLAYILDRLLFPCTSKYNPRYYCQFSVTYEAINGVYNIAIIIIQIYEDGMIRRSSIYWGVFLSLIVEF